jgi:hypothetical protein
MIGGRGGELGRRRDSDVRAPRAAGGRPGFRVVYPDGGGSAPVAPRQPAADVPRTSWVPSEGSGVWCVGGTSEREPAPERRGPGAAGVVFLLLIAAAAALQCWGAR